LLNDQAESSAIYVVVGRAVGIVASILPVIDPDDVRAWVLAALYLGDNIPPRNILPTTDVIMFIASTGTVIFTPDIGHG
jgi:hypothetical protein